MPPKLYLHPQNAEYFPESLHDFTAACRELGLIGDRIGPSAVIPQNSYLAGSDFLGLISFMGCSPYLKTTPDFPDDCNFTFVSIKMSRDLDFYFNNSSRKPKCPACNTVWTAWQGIFSGWDAKSSASTARCPACGENIDINLLDWKRTAGFVRFGLAISNIFPKEAIPSDTLLGFLSGLSGCEWKYFYC